MCRSARAVAFRPARSITGIFETLGVISTSALKNCKLADDLDDTQAFAGEARSKSGAPLKEAKYLVVYNNDENGAKLSHPTRFRLGEKARSHWRPSQGPYSLAAAHRDTGEWVIWNAAHSAPSGAPVAWGEAFP